MDDNKLTHSDRTTVNRNATTDNELSNEKSIDDELDENTFPGFYQALRSFFRQGWCLESYKISHKTNYRYNNDWISKSRRLIITMEKNVIAKLIMGKFL